jgi:hypothetical protein
MLRASSLRLPKLPPLAERPARHEGLDRGLGRQFHRSFYEQRLDERPQEGVQQLYLLSLVVGCAS